MQVINLVTFLQANNANISEIRVQTADCCTEFQNLFICMQALQKYLSIL